MRLLKKINAVVVAVEVVALTTALRLRLSNKHAVNRGCGYSIHHYKLVTMKAFCIPPQIQFTKQIKLRNYQLTSLCFPDILLLSCSRTKLQ